MTLLLLAAFSSEVAEMNENKEMTGGLLSTPHAAAVVVLGALAFLILINRGFRGVSVGGVSVGVK